MKRWWRIILSTVPKMFSESGTIMGMAPQVLSLLGRGTLQVANYQFGLFRLQKQQTTPRQNQVPSPPTKNRTSPGCWKMSFLFWVALFWCFFLGAKSPSSVAMIHRHDQEKVLKSRAFKIHYWLVVSTHLKNISQNGNFPQIGVKIKNI